MDRHALAGSDRHEKQPHGFSYPRSHPNERDDVTIRLSTTDEMASRAVCAWAINSKLMPMEVKPSEKRIKVAGSIENLEAAFGVELNERDVNGEHYRSFFGPITVPAQLSDVITGVFGLDTRKVATPRLKKSAWSGLSVKDSDEEVWTHPKKPTTFSKPPGTFTPLEVAELYGFPSGTGAGETIALIELGGAYSTADLNAYWAYLGIAGPTVQFISVNGGRNSSSDADGEVMLDIQVAGAIAPKAKIAIYGSPNTDQGFLDAVSAAIHDSHLKPSVVSISWGGPESGWSSAAMNAFQALFVDAAEAGITITVASGDNGSSDGLDDGEDHVDFPASAPGALACGGTRLVANGSTITSETVWNDGEMGGATGGGFSDVFPRPSYQPASVGTHRSVPDVAALADPDTGWITRVDGQFGVVGGTSAAAPCAAGLVARLNQITGKRVGDLHATLYANPSICRDITVGNNGSYSAKVGIDQCTGLGVIDGAALLAAIKA